MGSCKAKGIGRKKKLKPKSLLKLEVDLKRHLEKMATPTISILG